ncbi:MAG: electron transport complex subunit E [Clostridiales bacterium]|nr:electron transport complex subunit E [Clostridiales bacterium]
MKKKKSMRSVFLNGIFGENPIFRMLLGMCPTLAVSTAVFQGIGMGLATTFVLVFSNLVIALLRNIIPDKVRIPAFIVVIATFVTIVDLMLKAFIPSLSQSLGIFIPLIVVNCIIFARAEAFASKNSVLLSVTDGLGMGLGFTVSITLLSACRELLGNGTLLGAQVMPETFQPMAIALRPPGGFIMLGILLLIINASSKAIVKRREAKAKEAEL